MACECCGMQLRASPLARAYREKLLNRKIKSDLLNRFTGRREVK
jgi:hypothetical protein